MAPPDGTAAAELPSSPPLPLDDVLELDLPSSPVPYSSTHLPANLPNRKRQLADYESNLSSDPLFSEDPSEAADLTHYDRPRRKRMVKGPWWTPARDSNWPSPTGGDPVNKSFDSGVFMGSDGSDDSVDSVLSRRPAMNGLDETPRIAGGQAATRGAALAEHIIAKCLESGGEVVDLSDLSLAHLASETINPLHQLIRPSHNHLLEPPSEDEFAVLTPDIKLFLAGNNLAHLPDELFLLSNITVLSLRNNDLLELPPAIAWLRRLHELNVAGNNVQFLPWELFPFFESRKHITVRPNPLLEPAKISACSPTSTLFRPTADAQDISDDAHVHLQTLRQRSGEQRPLDMRSELELRLQLGRQLRSMQPKPSFQGNHKLNTFNEELIYLMSSKVRYLDLHGKPHPKCSAHDLEYTAVLDHTNSPPPPRCRSFAPSLFELALRSLQVHYNLDSVPEAMPAPLKVALQHAERAVRLGNRKCSTCARPFVVARAQWIEFWYNGMSSQAQLTQETILPFMRYACSWRCAEPSRVGEFR